MNRFPSPEWIAAFQARVKKIGPCPMIENPERFRTYLLPGLEACAHGRRV